MIEGFGAARLDDGESVSLPYKGPYAIQRVFGFLSTRCVAGIEEFSDGAYRRTVRLPHGSGIVELRPVDGSFACRARLEDKRDMPMVVQRCHALLDLDADPDAIGDVLRRDPKLRAAVETEPGLRIVGALDPHELAIRAVLGQQVSVAGAVTAAARVVSLWGEALEAPSGTLTHLFPTVGDIAEGDLSQLGMPDSRRRALRQLAAALAEGRIELDPGGDRVAVYESLTAVPGIGPWTASYIGMRALNDRDAFMASDLGARKGAAILGLPQEPRALEAYSERWRPSRAYALQYLWAAIDGVPYKRRR